MRRSRPAAPSGGAQRAGSGVAARARGGGELGTALRPLRRWLEQAGRAVGMRRTIEAGGLLYRELTAEPLGRALGRNGRGYKDFEVVFPDGSQQTIRATQQRVFADLSRPGRLGRYTRLERLVRPGMRVLELGCSTGYGTEWLAGRVGISGAVVAVDPDEQAVGYAARRYELPNASFEVRRADSLSGEINGAFHGVVWLWSRPTSGTAGHGQSTEPAPQTEDPAAAAGELWRVVAPGGWMVLGLPVEGDAVGRVAVLLRGEGAGQAPGVLQAMEPIGDPVDGVQDALFGKAAQP